jgi:hypothetical protein
MIPALIIVSTISYEHVNASIRRFSVGRPAQQEDCRRKDSDCDRFFQYTSEWLPVTSIDFIKLRGIEADTPHFSAPPSNRTAYRQFHRHDLPGQNRLNLEVHEIAHPMTF